MKSITNLSNEQKITLVSIFFSFIFLWLIGANEFKNNYLNYSTALSFAGSLLFLKAFLFTTLQSEIHLKSKNWFSFGLDILLCYAQIYLLMQGVRYLNQSSDPFNTLWFFLISSIIFFAQVYITKQVKLFPTLMVEIVLFAFLTTTLHLINIYTPEIQVYLLIQVGVAYSSLAFAFYSYFNMLKKTIE
jgi:hypothetical protein